MTANRIGWIDTARGIGIILVVVGHVERGLVDSGLAQAYVWRPFDVALYSFHMPLFMVLAGVHVPQSLAHGRSAFLIDKLRGLYFPYLLWSLIQGLLMLSVVSGGNQNAQWSDLWQLPWRPMWHFWFLAALMLYMLMVAATGTRPWVLVMVALAALATSQSMEVGGSLLYRVLFYLPFFLIGIISSSRIKALSLSSPGIIAIACALGWGICLFLLPWHEAHPYIALPAIPAALMGTLGMMALAQALNGRIAHFFAHAGRWSLSIYVMHVMAAAATRMLLAKILPGLPTLAYMPPCVLVGVACPMCIHALALRLRILRWIGLGRDRLLFTATCRK